MGDLPAPPTRSRARGPLLLLAGVAAVATLLAALLALGDAKVVAEGELLPWSESEVKQVEILGIRVYVDEEFWPRIDVLTTWVLAAIGSISGFAAVVLGDRADRSVMRFLVLVSAGAWWLCLDEALGLHETIGDNLGFLADLPGVRHPDDIIPALYLAGALAFGIAFRRILTASRGALELFAAAVAIAGCAAVADITDSVPDRVEDGLEVLATLFVLAGFSLLARDLVRRELLPAARHGAE